MRAALLTLTVIASQLTTPVATRVPELNVEKLCKLRSEDDKIMREPKPQSVADCVREEADVKQELTKIWAETDSSIRARCEGEAVMLGTRSYLDLLACLQLAKDIRAFTKGTGQDRLRK